MESSHVARLKSVLKTVIIILGISFIGIKMADHQAILEEEFEVGIAIAHRAPTLI